MLQRIEFMCAILSLLTQSIIMSKCLKFPVYITDPDLILPRGEIEFTSTIGEVA